MASAGLKIRELWFCIGSLLIAFLGTYTGSLNYSSTTSLFSVILLYLIRLLFLHRKELEDRLKVVKQLVLTAVFLLIIYSLEVSLKLAVWNWKDSNLHSTYRMENEALKGWSCNREMRAPFDKALNFIRDFVPKQDSLFVFPDATLAYGLLDRLSYKFAPFIFHLGIHPSPGILYQRFIESFRANPPTWILLHHQKEVSFYDPDLLLKWLKLDSKLKNCYKSIWREDSFEILKMQSCPQP